MVEPKNVSGVRKLGKECEVIKSKWRRGKIIGERGERKKTEEGGKWIVYGLY